MNVRLVPGEATQPRHLVHPFHAQDKVIHRAHPDVTVSAGNHDARWTSSVDLRGFWHLECLHFPMRSTAQCVEKWRNYERYAWGHDALRPLSKTPHDWYGQSLLMTPVDALDTLVLMKLDTDVAKAKTLIVNDTIGPTIT